MYRYEEPEINFAKLALLADWASFFREDNNVPDDVSRQELKKAVADIIRHSRPDVLEEYRRLIKQLNLSATAGSVATRQNLSLELGR